MSSLINPAFLDENPRSCLLIINRKHVVDWCSSSTHSVLGIDEKLSVKGKSLEALDLPFKLPLGNSSQTLNIDFEKNKLKRKLAIYSTVLNEKGGFEVTIEDVSAYKKNIDEYDAELSAFNVLINSTSDLIWSIDSNRNLVVFNNAYSDAIKSTIGKSPQQGDHVMISEFGAELNTRWEQYYTRALSGERFNNTEASQIAGEMVYVKNHFNPIRKNGKIIGASVFAENVTEQVLLDQEKNSYLDRLNAIANNVPGAIFQYKLAEDGTDKMLYVSKGAEELWGYSPDEIMKDNALVWAQFHSDDLESVQKSIAQSAQNLSQWKSEWRNINKDGSISWHRGSGSPRKIGDSLIWDSIILDVTERKVTELKLKEREAYLKSLYDNAFDAILSCDENGKLIFFNKKLREWVGPAQRDIKPEEYPAAFGLYTFDQTRLLNADELSLIQALARGYVENNRFCIKNKHNKNVRYVEANGARIVDDNGQVRGAMVIVRDITEVVQKDMATANAVLNAIEKERSVVASELHDNITQTLAMSKMNLGKLVLDIPELEQNQMLQRAKKLLSDSIEDTRELSHSIMPVSIKDFGLILSIQELLDELEQRSSIKTEFVYNKTKRLDNTLELNLFRIAQGALSNVRKHSNANKVWVKVSFKKKELQLVIKDNGDGFDTKNYHKDNKGIGIVSMRNRIERLNGNFNIVSSSKGTKLEFALPI